MALFKEFMMENRSSKTKKTENISATDIRFASFVGVDLHKCTVTLKAVNTDGKLIASLTIDTKCVNKIQDWIDALPRPCRMAVEAVSFAEWFIDRYRDCVDRIDIADATELANRRGKRRRTDRNDALDVAVRLARGDCPLGFIADEPLMRLRKLGRHWRQLSRTLSRAKHCIKSMLNAANIRGPKFDGASGQKWLLTHGHLLKNVQRDAFANFLDIIMLIERQRECLRRKIIFANRSKDFSARTTMLKSVPGIDEIWACIIAAEVGPFERFPNADTLEFWAGMTPDNKESAGRIQSGKITKAGSATLRWALCKAAVTLCKSDARQEAIRQRLIKRVGKAKANVAMGRRLLCTLYAMMRDGTLYERGKPTNHLQNANKARKERRKQKEVA
jgi:transposase